MGQPLRTRGATAALGLALVLALALGALSACSDDDPEPKFDDPTSEAAPQSSSTPTVTESTTDATEPTEPTTTEPPEQETAEEFIRRWAQIEKRMQNTGDTRPYRALTDSCESCDELADTVESYYEAGGFVSWGGWTIKRVSNYQGDRRRILMVVNSAPTRYRERAGGPIKRLGGGPGRYVFDLAKDGDTWLIAEKFQLA